MKYNPIKKVLILVTILAVPGFLYYLLQDQGKNRYKPLPIFGPKQVANTFHSKRGKQIPDTIYHAVADFKLVNQVGDSISLKDWKNKIVVLNLMDGKADASSTNAIFNEYKDFKAYQKNDIVRFASISIDPTDVLDSIKNLAATLKAKPHKWDILLGDSASIFKLVRKDLLLDVVEVKQPERKMIYSRKIVLLDSQHRIRGFYDATQEEALSKLDDEIKVLIAEELRNVRDGR
ncbi:SCO family protein [Nubsella zeaxanthinifaciens]|jgi:protein SCO1/2|uniref:SCO family protein n=1 Tax=Nubsella zeaxanthinifaciens TaxID=392412 RepID=UPI000DE1FCA0|nr:SCO family protein [Nubsella zeaxanthinifaciens]